MPVDASPRTRIRAVLLLLVVGSATSCSTDLTTTKVDGGAPPSYLFTLEAPASRFEPAEADGSVTLVLVDVDPNAIWFTDRPVRDSGVMTTDDLAALWDDEAGFSADPPNAAVVLHDPVDGVDTVVATMVDVSYDVTRATMTIDLDILDEVGATELDGHLRGHGDRRDAADLPAEPGGVTLFIDPIILCSNPMQCSGRGPGPYG